VGLAGTRGKRVGQFSLGMKQRLGIAAAMLHRPALLILDEPTNGLDPNGIIEMRDLLVALNREEGTTILVSSHLLAEVERFVTHVGIVHGGRLLFQGTLDALRRERKRRRRLRCTRPTINARCACSRKPASMRALPSTAS
jgi:ABC-2 type transport system ATP-binding protein